MQLSQKLAARPTDHAIATMKANRGRDTKPELLIRSALHSRGLRFRKNLRINLVEGVVRPDIVFTRTQVAVFVDGCFWHGCELHRSIPVTNNEFWKAKIERTRARDIEQTEALQNSGWDVIRVWEHESLDLAVARIEDRVLGRAS